MNHKIEAIGVSQDTNGPMAARENWVRDCLTAEAERDRLRSALERVQHWLGDADDSRTADDMDVLIADALDAKQGPA